MNRRQRVMMGLLCMGSLSRDALAQSRANEAIAFIPRLAETRSLALGPADAAITASERASTEALRRAIREAAPNARLNFVASIEGAMQREDAEVGLLTAQTLGQLNERSWVAAQQQCVFLLALDRRDAAVTQCQRAVQLEERAETYLSLAIALRARETDEDWRESTRMLQTMTQRFPSAIHGLAARCYLAMHTINRTHAGHDELVDCADLLRQRAPESSTSELFSFWSSLVRGNWGAAKRHLATLDQRGVDAALRTYLHRSLAENKPWWRTAFEWCGPAFALWLALFSAVFFWARAHSRRWLAALAAPRSTQQPDVSDAHRTYASLVLRLARTYRLSLLMSVGALSTLVFTTTLWALSRIERIPVQLLFGVGILLVLFAAASLASLSRVVQIEHEGEALPLRDHPALSASIERCCDRAGVARVREVYVTFGTNLEVYARAKLGALTTGEPELFLRLGAGLLDALDTDQLETLLVAELARAQRKENKGGAAALQIIDTFMTMLSGSAAADLYMGWFSNRFRSASLAVARAQEFIADRIAAAQVGPDRFESALRAFVQQNETFSARCDQVVKRCVERDEALTDVYEQARSITVDEADERKAIDAEWNRVQSPLASQASPSARVERVRAYEFAAPAASEPARSAWTLFVAPERLRQRMTDALRESYARQTGIVLRN